MTYDETIDILEKQNYKVVKHNDIVQKSRFTLSLAEQKTVNYLVSLIKPKNEYPEQNQPLEYNFEIQDYCKVCEIDYNQGKNYKMVRDTLKSLRDKSMILTLPDGTDTSVSWIAKFWSNKGSGKAKVRFDEDIAPYLFDICQNTTRFELLNVLPMQSKYSVRLYELCRSWAGIGMKRYTIEELRTLAGVGKDELLRYPDFRRKVLEIAQREINEHTDLTVVFEPENKGRKVVAIRIHIKEKYSDSMVGQMKIDDFQEAIPAKIKK